MNSNKQIAYNMWLDGLNTTPSEAFFPTFRQFLDLLVKENPTKIKNLKDEIDEKRKELAKSADRAIKELEKLLALVETSLKVKTGFNSQWGDFIAEGIVARPKTELFSRKGDRIITKIKHKDFV